MAAKRKGGKKAGKKKGAHKGTHKRGAAKKKGGRKAAKKKTTQLHTPNITSMASAVGKALGAGLKRPAGNALKRAHGKAKVKNKLHAIGSILAGKKRKGGGKKKGK